jgi:hypothetical protein
VTWSRGIGNEYINIKWSVHVHSSPRCKSPHWPLVSGFEMMTLTVGRSFPYFMRQKEFGLLLSTKDAWSLCNACRSTYTVDGSGFDGSWNIIMSCDYIIQVWCIPSVFFDLYWRSSLGHLLLSTVLTNQNIVWFFIPSSKYFKLIKRYWSKCLKIIAKFPIGLQHLLPISKYFWLSRGNISNI